MRLNLLFLICFLFSPTAILSAESLPKDPHLNFNNKILLFIGQDQNTIEDYIQNVHQVPTGFMVYTSLKNLEGLTSAKDSGAGIQHADYLIKKYPHSSLQIGLYLVGDLQNINKGRYDKNINKLIKWIKKVNSPIYLRIGYEFDAPQNNYEPKEYIQAYRRIVDVLNKSKIKNVFFVWHSYAGFVERNRKDWYPGNDYVDWIGLSFFDAYGKSFQADIVKLAKEYKKPLMIAEATPKGKGVEEGERTWKLWYKKLFEFIDENNVKALCYINADWEQQPMFNGQGWGNARVQDNNYIKNNWIDHINRDKFLLNVY